MPHAETTSDTELETPLTAKFRLGSFAWQLANLPVGESLAQVRRVPRHELPEYDRDAEHRKLDSIVNATCQRVSVKLGFKFRVERIGALTAGGEVMLFSVATRVA